MTIEQPMHLASVLFLAWIGLAVANFAVEFFRRAPDYLRAADHSYFQLVALVAAFLSLRFWR